MNSRVIIVMQDTTVYRLIHEYFNIYSKDSFPVVEDGSKNHLIGMVTFRDAWNVPNDQRNNVKVRDIMINKSNLIIMNYDRTADEALMQMTRRRISKVFICDPSGELVGLASKTDIMNAVSERKEFAEEMRRLAKDNADTGSK
jgi:predicted transcriptional regulator